MTRVLTLLLVAGLALSGCAAARDSVLNPFNWFGRAEPAADTGGATTERNALIPQRSILAGRPADTTYRGVPVQQVLELRVARKPGGAIVEAKGLAERLGAHDVRLVLDRVENGTLIYSMRTLYDPFTRTVGTARAREITAGVYLSDRKLEGVRAIRVESLSNALVSRR